MRKKFIIILLFYIDPFTSWNMDFSSSCTSHENHLKKKKFELKRTPPRKEGNEGQVKRYLVVLTILLDRI